jgi:hypothetical protein
MTIPTINDYAGTYPAVYDLVVRIPGNNRDRRRTEWLACVVRVAFRGRLRRFMRPS